MRYDTAHSKFLERILYSLDKAGSILTSVKIRILMHRTPGFTLIELLIVISIIGILTTFTIASYRNFDRNQKFNNARNDLINTLQVARSRASSQYAPASKCHQEKPQLQAYQVQIFPGSVMTTSVLCSATDPGTVQTYELSKIDLSSGVDTPITPVTITFKVQGLTVFSGGETSTTIILDGAQDKSVKIESNGRINALD